MPRNPNTYHGRSGARWRACVKYVRENMPWICWICGHEIDKNLDHQRDKFGHTVDHDRPLADLLAHGLDPYELSNLRPAHRSCNSSRGKSGSITTDRFSRTI